MRQGGKCLATFFLIDEIASANISAGLTTPTFAHKFGSDDCRVERPDMPKSAIAYPEAKVRALYAKHPLVNSINYGQWARGHLVPHWQDEVWASNM